MRLPYHDPCRHPTAKTESRGYPAEWRTPRPHMVGVFINAVKSLAPSARAADDRLLGDPSVVERDLDVHLSAHGRSSALPVLSL